MTVLSLLVSTALAAAPCAAAPVSAPARCSCIPPPPPREALAQADAVFAGTVVSVAERAGEGGMGVHEVRIVPTRRWKGAASDTVVVRTPASSAACGVGFTPGESYLVYASGREELSAILCSRTSLLAQAGEDVEALGTPGRAPIPVRKELP